MTELYRQENASFSTRNLTLVYIYLYALFQSRVSTRLVDPILNFYIITIRASLERNMWLRRFSGASFEKATGKPGQSTSEVCSSAFFAKAIELMHGQPSTAKRKLMVFSSNLNHSFVTGIKIQFNNNGISFSHHY